MDTGTVYDKVFVEGGMELKTTVNNPNFRIDTIYTDFSECVMNSSMTSGINGFDFYQSNQNQSIENYYSYLAVLGNPMGFSHTGFRGRCYAEILNASNYIVRSENTNTCIRAPYSYDYIKTQGNYSLYKSNRGVSLVYYYDNVISKETFLKLDPLSRETNLMYSMIIEDPEGTESNVVSDIVSVPFEIDKTNNVLIDGNTLVVQEDNGYIILEPDNIDPGQISIYLKGLHSSNIDSWYYRNVVYLLDSDNKPISIDYSAQYSETYQYYCGYDDIVFSFESIDEKVNKICLQFTNKGKYSIDDIQIYSRPYDQLNKTLIEFYNHADMDNISYNYSGNHLSISTTADSDKYLYVAIPYSQGWHADVDGKPVEIMEANIAFMAIPVTEGTHNIELTYRTPYLFEGLAISVVGLIFFMGYLFLKNKNRKPVKKS